ncbi:hypothetical protein BH11ARM2_BH11ARM2_02890 [soil metagenome]
MDEGGLLNAAVVLFARRDAFLPRYPQCLVRMAKFRGTDVTDDFADNRQEHANLFDMLILGQRFLRDSLPIAGRIVPDLFEREDDPLYPPAALREALANALCHRDYSLGGGSVSLAIYDDRLEIANSGTLPFGMTSADLLRPHASRPRNPLIAEVLYRRGIIEKWGRGISKMIGQMRDAGLEAPTFDDAGEQVMVRFSPMRYVPPNRVSLDLTPLQRQLLDVIAQAGSVVVPDLEKMALVGSPARRTIQKELGFLQDLELVDNRGRGKSSSWSLKGKTR